MTATFRCVLVEKNAAGDVTRAIVEQPTSALPTGDVTIRVDYSSLNFKDALAATGHPGVARQLPHVPGIDAAGVVETSESEQVKPGDAVLVTGYGMGEQRWGGWSELVRVPADWVIPLPDGLSPQEAMSYGTAGLCAAQAVLAILERKIDAARGPVIVTGATGGVGSIAVGLLAKCGYHVVAVTGKSAAVEWLRQLGAEEVITREEVVDSSDKPLLKSRWSAAVDCVGGPILNTLIRSTMHRAVVAACGLVAGTDLSVSVYPFLLRGVNLVGIDSAQCPRPERLDIWQRLAGPWKLDQLANLTATVGWGQLDGQVQAILKGQVRGRIVVKTSA